MTQLTECSLLTQEDLGSNLISIGLALGQPGSLIDSIDYLRLSN